MTTTVTFPQSSDAKTIDSDYDDNNAKTGAVRVSDNTVEIHPEDPKFVAFKTKYKAEIGANLALFADMPAYVQLYNQVKNLAPVDITKTPTRPVVDDDAAKAKADAAARRAETERSAAAKAEAEAARVEAERLAAEQAEATRVEAKRVATEKARGTPSYEQLPNMGYNLHNSFGPSDRIPATWFFDYVDNLEFDPDGADPQTTLVKLRDILNPIREKLLDPSDNHYVSWENLHDVAFAFVPTNEYHDFSRANANEEYNNYQGQSRETELINLAGGATQLANIRTELLARVIPHFQYDSIYITYQSTEPPYSLNAFIDPKGFVNVKIFKGQDNVPTFTLSHALREYAKSLNDMLGNSTDRELIIDALNGLDQYLESKGDTGKKVYQRFDQACDLATTLSVTPSPAMPVGAAPVAEAPLTFSEEAQHHVSEYTPLAYGNAGMQSIPAEWFDAYVDGNPTVSAALAPIRDTLYVPATNYTEVSLANFSDVFDSFNTEAPEEPIPAWNLRSQGVAVMQSWADSEEKSIIATMAGSPLTLLTAKHTIMYVIHHFNMNTTYHVFEFTTQRGNEASQIYTVYSFVDPEGSIDIRIAHDAIDKDRYPFFFTPKDLSTLSQVIGESSDKEIIKHGLKLARDLLKHDSAATTAFDDQIKFE